MGEKISYFERALFSVFSPIQHGTVIFFRTIGNLWERYFYLKDVQSQNQKMKEEIFSLRQENNLLKNALQKLKTEEEIKDKLSNIHRNILPAQVIGFDASDIYKSAIIDRGSLDGVKKDMVILDRSGYLVGRVISPITLKEARVQLITDKESGISIFSQNKKVMGVLSGEKNGYCIFKYVPVTNDDISLGENVITSGFDGIFPSGVLLGKIISITPTTSLFKKVQVQPFFDIRHLDHVAVIMKHPEEIF